MKKYIVSVFAALLSVGCLSGAVDSEVSLTHTFQLPIKLSSTMGTPTFSQDCYMPNVGNTFTKFSSESPNFSWKISNIKDDLDFGSEAANVSLSSLSLTLVNGDDIVVFSSPTNLSPQAKSVELTNPLVDTNTLHRILTSDTMQICLYVSGMANINSIVGVNNKISFNIEVNLDKNL